MLKIILLLILILTSTLSLAQASLPYALARKTRGLENVSSPIRERLEKLSLQVILKQTNYQILLSPEDIPESSTIEIFAIESEIIKDNDRFIIESKLLDIKNKRMVRKAIVRNIRESDLLRLFQASIEAVFKPKEEVPPPTEEKEKKEKIIPPPLPPQLNTANANAIDFKERINAMKNQINSQFKAIAEQKKVEESKDANDNKNAEKKNAENKAINSKVSNTSSAQLPSPPSVLAGLKTKSQYHAKVGWDKRIVDSQYLVTTKTNTEMLTLKLTSHNHTKYFSERLAWSYDLSVSKLVSGKIELPTLYQIGLFVSWIDTWGYFSAGFLRDKSFISNLKSPGEGIQISSLTSDWFLLKTSINASLLFGSKINLAYGVPLLVTSEISELQTWEGTFFQIGFIPPRLVANWDFNILLERIQLTNQGVVPFISEDSRIALLLQRSF